MVTEAVGVTVRVTVIIVVGGIVTHLSGLITSTAVAAVDR